MKVNEFLEQERSSLAAAEEQARAAADAYTASVKAFPYQCRREFLDWLSAGEGIPHDDFRAVLRASRGITRCTTGWGSARPTPRSCSTAGSRRTPMSESGGGARGA